MEDRELLRQFAEQNSQAAFTEVVKRHTDWVYAVCRRRLQDATLAEDATQAVFFALARKASSLTNQTTLSPWLFQAAKFSTDNLRRSAMRRARHELKAAAMMPTETSVEWTHMESEIEPLLDCLKSPDRQAILLKFYEQKSCAEIASLLGISEDAAQKRISRALDRVRAMCEKASLTVPTAGLGSLLSLHAVPPAPASLAAKLSTISLTNLPVHLAPVVKGILIMKAKTIVWTIAASLLVLGFLTTLAVLFYTEFYSPQVSSSPSPASASATATGIADTTGSMTLNFSARIDGSDVLNITPSGAQWIHKSWQWPARVTLNGNSYDPHTLPSLEQMGLAAADLSSAEVTERTGRDIIALEKTGTGIAIHFSDAEGGAAMYSMRIKFAPKSAVAATAPTTIPSEGAINLDLKARIFGSDMVNFTSQGAAWHHQHFDIPVNVSVNGQPWDLPAQPSIEIPALADADFSSAEVIDSQARDLGVVEKTDTGLTIYFSDANGGGSDYEIKLRIPKKK